MATSTNEHGARPDILGRERRTRTAAAGVAFLLDILIAGYALALFLIAVTGGVDLGIVSLSNPAKPILILVIAVPLRAALPVPLWPRLSARWSATVRALRARVQVSPAVADVSFAILVTWVFTMAVAFFASVLLPAARPRIEMPFETKRFAQVFAAWDSGWYFDIASRGYYFRPDGESSVPFFPLYPALMWLVAWPFGSTDRAIWVAGIMVSLVAFALALHALHRLTERLTGDRDAARRAVLYLAVFPFSLFMTRVYTEALYLLTTVMAIRRAYEGRWWQAGAWGAAATLTRPNGILILIPLGLLALRGALSAGTLGTRAVPLLLVPAAFAGYCAYVYTLSGDPLAWMTAQTHWKYSLGHAPWAQLLRMLDRFTDHGLYGYFFLTPMSPFRFLHGAVALLFLALTPAIFRRFGVPLGSYVLVSLLVPLSGNALEGIGRYAVVLFPAFMLAAEWQSRRLQEGIIIGSALLLALLNCLFVTLYPIY